MSNNVQFPETVFEFLSRTRLETVVTVDQAATTTGMRRKALANRPWPTPLSGIHRGRRFCTLLDPATPTPSLCDRPPRARRQPPNPPVSYGALPATPHVAALQAPRVDALQAPRMAALKAPRVPALQAPRVAALKAPRVAALQAPPPNAPPPRRAAPHLRLRVWSEV